MSSRRSWKTYHPTYRAREMQTLARWIDAGQSASVIGLAGAGKSNLLGFLCHRPEVLESYLPPGADPVTVVPVDLNNLPADTLDTFYRVILRAFYEMRERFDRTLRQAIVQIYRENRATRDPFLAQSALREMLLKFQGQQRRVVLMIDRFDKFGQIATAPMLDTLRGLRDSFKVTLSYIVGMRQEVVYLFDPGVLGEMYEILDTHVCWVGPMDEADARRLIAEESANLEDTLIPAVLSLTGGYPALLKATCHWLSSISSSNRPPSSEWASALLEEHSIQSRMEEIWAGLTQEERQALSEIQACASRSGGDAAPGGRVEPRHRPTLASLARKGLFQSADDGWRIFSPLFAAYVAAVQGESSGKIWLDETTEELYQGADPLRYLSPLERSILHFLVEQPRIRHTKTDLIVGAWPDELRRQGVTDDSLYQVISELRKKIEPNPAQPCYVITWRGRPEGGYQFFPEGRPGQDRAR